MSTIGVDRFRRRVSSIRGGLQEALIARRMRARMAQWAAAWPTVPELEQTDLTTTTVVVPCFNHAAFLPHAVQSLLDQTLSRFDSVLVDDASSDQTGHLLNELASRLRDRGSVTVVRHDWNQGQAASLNEGIGLARTPLVTVLNDDDSLSEDTLSSVLRVFRSSPEVALVGTGSRWFTGPGRPPSTALPSSSSVLMHNPVGVRLMRQPQSLNMTHSGMTLLRAAWQLVGGYRSRVGDRLVPFSDRDMQLRVGALYPVAVIESPLVWWRSDSSVDGGLNS